MCPAQQERYVKIPRMGELARVTEGRMRPTSLSLTCGSASISKLRSGPPLTPRDTSRQRHGIIRRRTLGAVEGRRMGRPGR